MEKNLTSGSVFKNIVFFSLPYLLSYFLQTLYGMADLFIIGQFEGVDSITAVSVGSQVMHMHSYDRGTCHGLYSSDREGGGSPEKAGDCISDRKYGNFIYGSGSGFYCAVSGIR